MLNQAYKKAYKKYKRLNQRTVNLSPNDLYNFLKRALQFDDLPQAEANAKLGICPEFFDQFGDFTQTFKTAAIIYTDSDKLRCLLQDFY